MKTPQFFARSSFLVYLTAPAAFAFFCGKLRALDNNANGMSDLFETTYGLTDPNADPDADGLTNLQESLLGGDPLVKDTPGQAAISLYQYLSPEDGALDFPQIDFVTVPGKRYRLEYRGADDIAWRPFYWAGVAAEFTASATTQRMVDRPRR